MAFKCVGNVVSSRALRFTLVVVVAALAGPVAACGGSGSTSGSGATPTAKATSEATNATANASAEPGSIVFRRWSDASHTHGAILTMASNGSRERQLDDPTGSLSDDYPDITPDGRAVAFQRCGDSESSCAIFAMPADGTHPRRVGGCRPGERPPRCADSSYPAIPSNARRSHHARSS